MATPLIQSIQQEFDQINNEYAEHFAGQSRATRDLNRLASLTSRTKSLLARIETIPAAARGADITSLANDISEQIKLFDAERGNIERAKKAGPALEKFAPLATAANFTFARYVRHFAGQSRDTRDPDLLDEMIEELVRLDKEMGDLISKTSGDAVNDFRNDQNTVRQNLDMYRQEREQIVKIQSSGSPEAQAERAATLANNQFELYRQNFAGHSRVSRRPQLLQRMIKNLERTQGIMEKVQKSGFAPDFNAGNLDIVKQNLDMYRSELAEIRKAKEQNKPEDIAGELGDAANKLFAEYREGFAGKNRTQVDQKLLSSICDRLYEVFRQMRDLVRLGAGEMNTKNLEIVTDQLSLFTREYDAVGEAQKGARR